MPTHVGNRKNKNRATKAVGETPQELQSSRRRLSVCQRVHDALRPVVNLNGSMEGFACQLPLAIYIQMEVLC